MFWVRVIGGGIAGLFLAIMLAFLIEWPTQGWFNGDGQLYKALTIYVFAAIAGGACAAKIGGMPATYATTGLLCVFNLATVLTGTYPWWFLPSAILVIGFGTFIGSRFVSHPDF